MGIKKGLVNRISPKNMEQKGFGFKNKSIELYKEKLEGD